MNKILWGLLAISTIVSCKNNSTQDKKEDELDPLAYTLYTDKTELFVELKPLVVGEESRFAAHFTALGESFKPVTEGSVSLVLSGPGGNQSVKADAPSNPGIFRLAIKTEKPGVYKLTFNINTAAYSDQLVIDTVTVYPNEKSAKEHQQSAPSGSNEITYLKEQAWKIDFATIPVQRTSFYNIVKTSGMVTAAAGDEQTLTAKTSGVVNIVRSGMYTGSPVGAGQPLFTISSKGFTDNNANVELQQARNNLAKAKIDFERNSDLYKDRLITQKEYLQSKNEYENAQTLYRSLSANYGQAGQAIASTQSGFIKSLLVTQGQFVESGQPLAVVSKNKQLAIKAEISQSAFSKINSIKSANFRINSHQVLSLEELNGKLLSIGKTADSSPFIPVFFGVDNKEGFLPGTFIEVFIKTDAIQNALVIPMSAVLEDQGTYYCYVQTAGETFEKRELTLGGNDGKNVQVLSGLQEGDRVVTKGGYNIKLSTASGAVPAHGHEH